MSKRIIPDTFMAHVERLILDRLEETESGCWLYTGSTMKTGYAMVGIHGRSIAVHRASYIYHVGPIPDAMDLDHKCHSRAECQRGVKCPHRRCCNPAHLKPVTRQEHARRTVEYRYQKRTRVSAEDISNILWLYDSGDTYKFICAQLGVSSRTIANAVKDRELNNKIS